MSFNAKNKMILVKEEATYGVDPTPVEGSNAILTKNLTRNVYEGNKVQRDLDRATLGGDESINTGPYVTISFDVELAGGSGAGVAPQYGPLLKACGLSETVVAVTSVTYAPVSTSFDSVTIYYNYDGEQQVIVGARGNVSINMTREGIPYYSFTFTGLYARPTAVTMYDPTFIAQTPRPFNDTNTTAFSVHSQAVYGEGFSLDMGNLVAYRNLAGFTGVVITDRDVKGNVLFEAVPIATKDFYAATESHAGTIAKDAISVVHGAAAGAICTISLPTAQLQNMTDQESDGIKMNSIDYGAIPTESGNDELSIAYT